MTSERDMAPDAMWDPLLDEAAHDSRLSHDRGADADEAWNALAVDLRHNTGFGAGDPGALINHHRPAIEAALRSVPAPTLPMCTFPGCSCAGTLPAIPTDPS